jgi:hypothetical protein
LIFEALCWRQRIQETKVFWFFFSKKNALLSVRPPRRTPITFLRTAATRALHSRWMGGYQGDFH